MGVERKVRGLKPGWVVEVLWVDSGRDTHSRRDELATRYTYGRVDAVLEDTLRLAMDVCTGEDEHDDGGNRWGLIWIPSIKLVEVLRR